MNESEKFNEFNKTYGLTKKEITHENALKTTQLIADELQEFLQEFYCNAKVEINITQHLTANIKHINPNLNNAFKELEDIRYITGQQAAEYGADVSMIGAEVHRSNMSKSLDIYNNTAAFKELDIARKRYPDAQLIPHGDKYILKCAESGKVIKPSCYSPAVITKQMIGSE